MFLEGPRGKIVQISDSPMTFSFSGELDETNVDKLFGKLYQDAEGKWGDGVVFDFTGLEYLNSKAIGFITDIHGIIDDSHGTFQIINASLNVYDILDIVGVTKIIDIQSS